jgi:phage-related protein
MTIIYLPKARSFIENLDILLAARTNKMLDLLRDRGYELRMPFSRSVEDGIFELRIVGTVQTRLLYFFHRGEIVIAHAVSKKTKQLSRRDIEYALQARKMFIASE